MVRRGITNSSGGCLTEYGRDGPAFQSSERGIASDHSTCEETGISIEDKEEWEKDAQNGMLSWKGRQTIVPSVSRSRTGFRAA